MLVVWTVVRTAAEFTVVAGAGVTTLGPATISQTSTASALSQGGTWSIDVVLASAATAASAVCSVNGLAGFPSNDGVNAPRFDANSGYEVPTTPATTPGKPFTQASRTSLTTMQIGDRRTDDEPSALWHRPRTRRNPTTVPLQSGTATNADMNNVQYRHDSASPMVLDSSLLKQ